MNAMGFLAVGVGSVTGSWLRWWLGLRFNQVFPSLPLGTLAANLIGGYVIGVALGLIVHGPGLSTTSRQLLMTGFCGGLTTFSTFSAEVFTAFSRGELAWGFSQIAIHVCGSLAATTAGFLSVRLAAGLLGAAA